MQIQTVLLIILAGIIALAVVVYQYYRSLKKHKTLYLALMVLRFLAIFCILLLLINPKFSKENFFLEKSNLLLLADNSSSIKNTGMSEDVDRVLRQLEANQDLNDKFNVMRLNFDREVQSSDSLDFEKEATDIQNALTTVNRTYNTNPSAIVLLTDGNQTIGTDYEFFQSGDRQSVYPVVIGDTTRFEDLKIEQVNVNRYAFLDNQYPIEIFLRYQGDNEISVPLDILIEGSVRYREIVRLNKLNNSKKVEALLQADEVGLKLIRVQLGSLENERNTTNNLQNVAVEVIDEKTQVAIIADVKHPDIGAFKKSIEVNNQRSVRILRPDADDSELLSADMFILYQPNRAFQNVYRMIDNRKINYFTITGPNTNWDFLNQIQTSFQKNSYDQSENVRSVKNSGFSSFDISEFSVDNFPPLITTLGDLLVTQPSDVILEQRIRGVEIGDPLLTVINKNPGREVALFGENLWKWRVQNYRNDGNFDVFNNLIAKIILFLSTDDTRERLNLDYENIYRDSGIAKFRVSYFDEAFEFNSNANITLFISGRDSEFTREIPMLVKGAYYEADLSSLPAGTFDFTVRVAEDNAMRSGQFTILDFDVEKQFLTTDFGKLERLAQRSGGKIYFPDQSTGLIEELVGSEEFRPTQKSEQNIVSLIDFKVLLMIVVSAFTAEWFIRKYNGLI